MNTGARLDQILPALLNGQSAKFDDLFLSGSAGKLSAGTRLAEDPRTLTEETVLHELRRIRSQVKRLAEQPGGFSDLYKSRPFEAYVYVGKPDQGTGEILLVNDDGAVRWIVPLATLQSLIAALDRFDPARYLPSYWPKGSHYAMHPIYAETLYRECCSTRMVKTPEAFRKFVDKTMRIYLYWGNLSKCKPDEKSVFLARFDAFLKEITPILRAKFD